MEHFWSEKSYCWHTCGKKRLFATSNFQLSHMQKIITAHLLTKRIEGFFGARNWAEKSFQACFEDVQRARTRFRGEIVPVIAAEAALKHRKHGMPIMSAYTYQFAWQVIQVPKGTFNGFNNCAQRAGVAIAYICRQPWHAWAWAHV